MKMFLRYMVIVAILSSYLVAVSDAEFEAMKKKMTKLEKEVAATKKLANGDNLKWSVDFRTAVDKLEYTMADENATKHKNDSLLTNRLWLNMAYAPTDNISFRARMSYLKAYGAEANNNQRGTGNDNFDWVSNEAVQGDNSMNLKQAFWLYRNDTFLGSDISWTASIGRRPATDGLLANFREDANRQSALAHAVNVGYDGASFRWNLDKVTPLTGAWIKLCLGRGVTNAVGRFAQNGADYAKDDTLHLNSNMAGVIAVPYDDGQYSIHMMYAKANNLIGYDVNGTGQMRQADGTYGAIPAFTDHGGMSWMTGAIKVEGIGNEITDFLDDTTFFISFAQSKSDPDETFHMLGSDEEQTGQSTWVGLIMPDIFSDDGKFGFEWNKGSEYWRSMTYGEDTMIGSKIAARGTAIEAYYFKPLTKALSMNLRYTKIEYDYSGSNGFFGNASAPQEIKSTMQNAGGTVAEATDLRAYLRYRF
ncbi:MAG: hypothetical protein B1H07_04390 [Campylobacteraceae bacterium 4484_166]|nr:MAG: hypothetical protein B1H07_04390 [Campylobacteraceae bacterium 4484_166]